MKLSRPFILMLLITTAHYFHHQLTALVVPLLPFMRDGFQLSYTEVGVIVSAFSLSYGIGQLPAGWLADRIGPRYLLLTGIGGVAVAGVAVGLSQSYTWLVVFLIVMGLTGGGYHPSATPIISVAVPAEQRGRAVGMHLMGGSLSHLVAPILGVGIATYLGWRGSFLVIAAPVAAFGVVVFFVIGRILHDSETENAARPELNGALTAVASAGHAPQAAQKATHTPPPITPLQIGLFLALTSVVAALTTSSVSFVPLHMVDSLGVGSGRAALALSIFFGAGLVAAPLSGLAADRWGIKIVFTAVAAAAGPLIVLFAYTQNLIVALVLLFLLGCTMFARMTVSESFLVTAVSKERRSTVLGIYFFAGIEGGGLLTPVVGNLIDRYGFRVAYTTTGAAMIVALAILAGFMAWSTRPRPAAPLAEQ